MMEHTKEEYLSWFKCRSVGETFTSDDWVARDLLFAEIERLKAPFRAGMTQAVWTLRNAANTHEAEAALSKKLAESEGHAFAARVLRSYANGLEIEAEGEKA